MKITWSRQARSDLRAIRDFIARDSEHYSRLQINRLIERVEYISTAPSAGHPVHEFPDLKLRETHQESYRIIYGFDSDELHVVTIVHMKQQVPRRRLAGRR
jgi:plasmid stabilization system protein ParE